MGKISWAKQAISGTGSGGCWLAKRKTGWDQIFFSRCVRLPMKSEKADGFPKVIPNWLELNFRKEGGGVLPVEGNADQAATAVLDGSLQGLAGNFLRQRSGKQAETSATEQLRHGKQGHAGEGGIAPAARPIAILYQNREGGVLRPIFKQMGRKFR